MINVNIESDRKDLVSFLSASNSVGESLLELLNNGKLTEEAYNHANNANEKDKSVYMKTYYSKRNPIDTVSLFKGMPHLIDDVSVTQYIDRINSAMSNTIDSLQSGRIDRAEFDRVSRKIKKEFEDYKEGFNI